MKNTHGIKTPVNYTALSHPWKTTEGYCYIAIPMYQAVDSVAYITNRVHTIRKRLFKIG